MNVCVNNERLSGRKTLKQAGGKSRKKEKKEEKEQSVMLKYSYHCTSQGPDATPQPLNPSCSNTAIAVPERQSGAHSVDGI